MGWFGRGKKDEEVDPAPPPVEDIKELPSGPDLEYLAGIGGQLSFGTMAGWASGLALKTAGRAAAVAVGAAFCTIQVWLDVLDRAMTRVVEMSRDRIFHAFVGVLRSLVPQ